MRARAPTTSAFAVTMDQYAIKTNDVGNLVGTNTFDHGTLAAIMKTSTGTVAFALV